MNSLNNIFYHLCSSLSQKDILCGVAEVRYEIQIVVNFQSK